MSDQARPDAVTTLLRMVQILDRLHLRYAVGGSVASSIHGEPRSTADVDLLVDLTADRLAALLVELKDAYYFGEATAREAVLARSSFNVIDLRTMHKVDLFVAGSDWLDREQLSRRVLSPFTADEGTSFFVTSAEVLVLRKLRWYRRGGGVSERQWRDVLGVLKAQRDRLDLAYLKEGAGRLGLLPDLERALREADSGR